MTIFGSFFSTQPQKYFLGESLREWLLFGWIWPFIFLQNPRGLACFFDNFRGKLTEMTVFSKFCLFHNLQLFNYQYTLPQSFVETELKTDEVYLCSIFPPSSLLWLPSAPTTLPTACSRGYVRFQKSQKLYFATFRFSPLIRGQSSSCQNLNGNISCICPHFEETSIKRFLVFHFRLQNT